MTLDQNIFLRTTMLSCEARKIMKVMRTKSDMYMFISSLILLLYLLLLLLFISLIILFFIHILTEEMLS
jgi:hypothetical protein